MPTFLEKLSDEELKKEAKNEAKNDALSSIVKLLKGLAGRAPGQEDTVQALEMFRLKMILRWDGGGGVAWLECVSLGDCSCRVVTK